MAFATVDDLAHRLRADFTAEERAYAVTLLERVTDLIRATADQHIYYVIDDVITLWPHGHRLHLLPERPVVAVASIVENGRNLAAPADYTWSRDGILARRSGSRWVHAITVTYSHGHAEIPGDLRSVCIEASARQWRNPGGLSSEQIGSWSGRWATDASGGLTEDERLLCRGYRP